MKVHKITADRIFFQTDSGAYGSIDKKDVRKLQIASKMGEGFVDARRVGGCMVDQYVAEYKETKDGSSNPE